MLWINVAVILSYIPSIVQGYGYLIDRDLIAKKDGFKFNLHSGSGVVRGKAFHSLGCWKDTWIRAIQPLEKRHVLLMNGNYKLRDDPLRKCAIAALDNKMKLFAIENGGQCLGETTITSSYKKYGATNHCKDDGYGGPWSMQVYGFTRAKLRRHGGYSKWSSWTKCVGTCGKGIEKRFRTCSHPSPAHGGRDCSRLGPGMETRPCASECLGTEDDDLEDSSKSDNSKDKTKASKKSDDTDDYLDDDDDDDDLDDDDDKSSNNFENKPNKINGGKNKNQADDSESNPSYKSAEKDVFKNSYAKISKPLDHFAQYQGTNIGGNSNAKFSKSAHMVGNDLDKTQSGSPVLKSTSDMIKSDGEMTNDSPPLSQSSTVGENSKNIAFGNKAGDSDSNSALANGLSGTSGAAGTIKQPTLNQGGKPKENNDQSTGAANGSTVKNHLSDISNTQTSDASMKVTSTTESELGNSEEKHDENASDEDLSESKSTMENNMSDSSKTSSNVHDVKGSTQDTTDTKPDNTGEKVDEGLSNDEDKSTMDNDASDVSNSESSDNGAHMKEVNQSAEKTQPDAMVESDGSSSFDAQNNPPITKQMKAAQDLLRSRWLSLAKSGNLKPTPLKQSTKVSENPSKPVVDVSLKEDSEEDFEDKEMDNDQSEHADGTNEASTAESELDDKEDDEEASDNENKVNVRKLNGEKENEEKVDSGEVDQTTDEWKEEERGRNVEETEERLNDETTKEKSHERHNENGEDTKMNDNQAVDEGQSLVHEKVDEPSMNEDTPAGSVSDDTMNAPETEKHVEALNDHKEDDTIEETERKEDKDVMHDKMSEEDGAKRIKEECVCPVLDLMGKPGPNTTPCPCLTEPSKKASPPNKPMNTEMTKEEYTTGMFHAGLPKVDSSSTTSPQPLSGGTTLPSTSSTPPAKKPLTAMSETKPSGEIVPAPTTPLDTSGVGQPASSLTSDKTPIGNQKVATSSQPATQSMPSIPPNAAVTTQATSPKATSKVVHIKNDKLKPLSKTLSRLGENLNKANSEGELNKGSYAIDTDIHNLLSTIGKLKAQVDSLRNDKEQLGSNDAVWTKQSGTGSGLPSQSKGTQSKTNNESIKETGKNKKTDSSRLLKLRIVDQTANEQKNATILHLKLSDNIKAVKNKSLDKPLDQNHGVGNTATTNTALHDTTLSQLTNSATPSGQTMSIKVPKSPAHIQNEKISTKAKQNKNTANVEGVTQNVNDKRPQQINSLSPVNGAQQNVQTTVSGIDVKTSQSTATGATVKQPANALDNVKQTTSPATTSQPKTSLQDANPTKQKPQTITPPQQNVSTTQVTSPSTTTQLTSPSTTTQVTSPPTTTQLTSPSATTQVTSPSTTTQVTSPQTNTPPQESVNTSQKPLPSVTQSDGKSDGKIDQAKSPQSDGKIDQAKSPQSNTIVQPLQQNIVPHKFANTLESIVKPQKPLPSPYPTTHAKANAGGSSLVQTAAQSKTKDFNAIESTLANIVKTQQATPKSTIPACNINLGFVLDGSASVEGTRRGNFLKMINFVKDMIHAFVELSQQVHVGTLVYSTNSSVILSFGTKGTEKVIDQILDSIHYPGQGSLTGKAIKDAWNLMFSSVPRGRKSKLLLLTDGPSNDDVKMPSKWVRDNGVEMFVIGLGQGYDSGELQDMASLPSDKHIITKDYDDLRTSVQEVRNKVCGFNADQVLRIMTNARFSDGFTEINAFQRTLGHKQCILDMVFLLDGSRQVETNGEGNFQREISFVKKAAKYLPLSRNDVHIGVGLLGDPNVMVFPMNEHYTQKSIDFELDHIRYPASSDIQSLEIKYARRLMLTKGIRDVAPRVFVLVTDVSSIDSYREAIDELRTDGSDVAMFGVGSDAYKQEVKVRSTVQGLVDQVVTLDSEDESEAAKHFAINMCKISNAKRTEIPRLNWKASDKIINQN